ncbi:MAG: sodium:glutamate symporter [Bacillota bacterium]|nr:sodium:glutamate symporter [Bacillota bacterium]
MFIRKTLIPTAVLAGFLALFLRLFDFLAIDPGFMEMITYHTIALGFIALSLRVPERREGPPDADFTAAKSGALIVSTYLVQAIVGLGVSITLAYTFMPEFFKAAGLLLPMGYGQGPGQANNVGSTYEVLGFAGGQSFGLSIAAAGFLVACTIGVIDLNIQFRRHRLHAETPEVLSGSVTVDAFQSENELPVSESVDRLSVQIALVLLVYMFTYLFSKYLTEFLAAAAPGISATVSPLIWGFNFVIGALLALICRKFFDLLTKSRIMTHQYPNNYLLSRISGCAFDIMVIAGICAIDIKDLKGLWLPFLLMAVLGAVVTYFYLKWLCRKIYPSYYYEGFFSMFGMMTGTISSGILLLREIDPSFKTPAANNLLTGTSFAILLGAPMLILIGMAPKSPSMLFLSCGLIVLYLLLLLLFIFKAQRRK